MRALTSWCKESNLSLNVSKTKEVIVDFRRGKRTTHVPLMIEGTPVEIVDSYKYLGVHITKNLRWDTHISSLVKKTGGKIFYLRRLKKVTRNQPLLKAFYTATVESVLTGSITAWYGNCSTQDKRKLKRVIRTAERIVGSPLPCLDDIYRKRCRTKAEKIRKDSSHPRHHIFQLMRSGRLRNLRSKTKRMRRSFFPQAIRILNDSFSR